MNTVGGEPDAAMFMDSGLRRNDGEGHACAVTIWDQALARFNDAQAVLDASKSEPDEDAYDALLDSHSDALAALLALPAPDLPALAAKLDVIVPQMAWELTGTEDCLERLRQDAHRLASAAD
ncbi:MAG TPA: hypothetical protein VK403_14670 [Allosphingosinicella sp.]|nr:hypothetical protein [Allosphingosinicella sp.]